MNQLAKEFRDVLNLYVKLTADLTRIADTGVAEEDPQALIQSILDNRSCLTEIQQLNKRLTRLYGVWKDKEKDSKLSAGDEIRGVVDDVREQMRQLEKLCGFGAQKIEERRKQLSGELTNVGKNSRYLKMLNPVQENHPKFIDSAC
ncbi:MAG: hypothetical protein LBJ21_08695 [Acidobacteriota bacterium]|jgi:hypothetical protein|nr:hypothetical protein [Acidobacteriota bacterium]